MQGVLVVLRKNPYGVTVAQQCKYLVIAATVQLTAVRTAMFVKDSNSASAIR